ncbi:metallophosphoesterase family protein [Roseomonas xinghualingensis]|uniref:metallophosphoesterase family protein n=1 Tax=Roseomonas xinghualingensis TaxID=2986475 RepID=UPI0021F15C7C|nr:metallophosphoesterase [Roseomonas sp. SXEYE001]MCV4207620.1 metallophosphoesterase [Roseomonas sp. SXEYE001]
MRVIDHISDLHFCRIDQRAADALLDRLNAEPAHLVAISGDLTMRARRNEFRTARAFLDKLCMPWIAVPGNHDITAYYPWERFLNPFGRWESLIAPDTEPMFEDEEIQVVGLNTVSRGGLHLQWENGKIPRAGLLRALRRIRRLKQGPFRIVVAHHPFLAPPDEPHTPLVRRGERALRDLARSGVRLVLSGHLHVGYHNTHAVTAEAGDHLTVLQAGSAISTRLRGEPNAYNRVVVENGRARWTAHHWDGEAWR